MRKILLVTVLFLQSAPAVGELGMPPSQVFSTNTIDYSDKIELQDWVLLSTDLNNETDGDDTDNSDQLDK